ncbi:hypothetical protein HG535_0G01160 [Zygotorulaspora mrakii]|uniref:Histone chaperone RTT106 n=1 Tax=Zygotorulaspora mrakii TaxID=42260 RepID=A0A7H9B914_ZYGMR|nr:uncharacterized protein HG535_0G01160 [Zygotorulaspora mrakii]QLG74232.1 hypothetical protein HG535_0G01160 [Zygotorulaspora mrakii]
MDPFLDRLPDDLRSKIVGVANALPESLQIFEELYEYLVDNEDGRKMRKLGNTSAIDTKEEFWVPEQAQTIFKLEDVSVLFPVRKKMDVVLHLSSDANRPVLSLIREGRTEMSITNLGKNITMATFLAVAEKENKLYLFVRYTESVGNKYSDPLLIMLGKDVLLAQFKKAGILTNDVDDFTICIEYMRKQAILAGFRISDPFFSTPQSIKENPSFHVECHRGTKEGTLYFLPDHIIFGFKKPILLFDSSEIESITYSSITRLTFNVTMVTKAEQKFEFSMIDQNEYTKIDEYVKRKQVMDKSMSEELKAKSKNKSQQQSNESISSALEEAAQQIESESIGIAVVSDDNEDDDQNFEAESDLSDGSGSENESGENPEDEDEEDEEDVEEAEEADDAEEAEEEAEEHSLANVNKKTRSIGNLEKENEGRSPDNDTIQLRPSVERSDFSASLGLEDIPIELDGDDDDDDDEEGSGVEY